MADYLRVLILLAFCVYSESSIRMQRDFSYPVIHDFDVYWNVPTFLCHKYGVHFQEATKKYGIIANPNDQFRGSKISILYDPGLFPAMMKNAKGRLLERNGGIPQLGNLTEHLDSFKEIVEKVVPEDFEGVGVIDFEAWRPIFRQNWNDQTIYKVMSKELERQHHPQWPEKKVELQASSHFEEASKIFMENTLKVVKLLRPRGTWGYYAFPYCYNYRESKEPHCSDPVERENNRIQWLFDESTAIYPSIYMSHKLTEEEHRKFVIGRLNEAWRVASRVSSRKIPLVFPYVWYQYYDSSDFLTQGDIYTALETTRRYKMGGAVIWGATENVSSKSKCLSLLDYLNTVLGPAVARVKQNKDETEEQGVGFVLLPFIHPIDSAIANVINHNLLPTTTMTIPRQERPTSMMTTRQEAYTPMITTRQDAYTPMITTRQEAYTPMMTTRQEAYTPMMTTRQEAYTPMMTTGPQEAYTPMMTTRQEAYTPMMTKRQEAYTPMMTTRQEAYTPTMTTGPQELTPMMTLSPRQQNYYAWYNLIRTFL